MALPAKKPPTFASKKRAAPKGKPFKKGGPVNKAIAKMTTPPKKLPARGPTPPAAGGMPPGGDEIDGDPAYG